MFSKHGHSGDARRSALPTHSSERLDAGGAPSKFEQIREKPIPGMLGSHLLQSYRPGTFKRDSGLSTAAYREEPLGAAQPCLLPRSPLLTVTLFLFGRTTSKIRGRWQILQPSPPQYHLQPRPMNTFGWNLFILHCNFCHLHLLTFTIYCNFSAPHLASLLMLNYICIFHFSLLCLSLLWSRNIKVAKKTFFYLKKTCKVKNRYFLF